MTDRRVRRVPDAERANGSTVVCLRSGRGQRVRGYGAVYFSKGDQLIVRGVNTWGLRVRHPGGVIFRIDARNVAPVDGTFRYLGDVPEGAIAPDDPRLDWLWRDAAKLATATGHCREYDALVAALGIPGRERPQHVAIEVAPGVELRSTVRARSMSEAERLVVARVRAARPPQLAIEGDAS